MDFCVRVDEGNDVGLGQPTDGDQSQGLRPHVPDFYRGIRLGQVIDDNLLAVLSGRRTFGILTRRGLGVLVPFDLPDIRPNVEATNGPDHGRRCSVIRRANALLDVTFYEAGAGYYVSRRIRREIIDIRDTMRLKWSVSPCRRLRDAGDLDVNLPLRAIRFRSRSSKILGSRACSKNADWVTKSNPFSSGPSSPMVPVRTRTP